MYKYILLDLDETIWNFKAAEKLALEDTLKAHGIPVTAEITEFYRTTNQSLWKALERKEITKDELKVKRFRLTCDKARELAAATPRTATPIPDTDGTTMNNTYMRCLSTHGIMLDGAEEFLKELDVLRQQSLIRVYYITNGIDFTARGRIKASDIEKYADGIFISDEVGVEKPDRKFFDFVMASAGDSDPKNYLVIGDSLSSDIQGAENAGMDSCLFAYYGRFPEGADSRRITYRAATYREILDILTPCQPGS